VILPSSSQPLRGMISRTLTIPCSSIRDDAIEGSVRAEQINSVKRYLPSILLANICNAMVLVAALWASSQRPLAVTWAAAVLLLNMYYGIRHYLSFTPKPTYVSARAINRSIRNALLLGALWATLPLLFFANASTGGQVIIACLCAGMLGGGAFALASIPAAAIAFTAPIVIASAIAIGRSGEAAYLLVAVLMISYISVLWRGIYVYASQIAKRVTDQVIAERRARCDE
jgi:diguanylate cyclase